MMRAFLTLMAMAGALSAGPVGYRVFVDTSAFAGFDGQAEFQFNPGGSPDALTAEVSAIAGVASYSEASRNGDVTGADPWLMGNGGVFLPNMVVLNLEGFTNIFSFTVTLAGDALDTPSSFDGTSFTLTMRDENGDLLGGFSEPALWLDIYDGSVSPLFQDQQITLADVPEPAALGLAALGFLLMAGRRRCFPG